jgi:adenosine deaminase
MVPAQADVNTYFNHIKNNPNALYQFFKLMPKGGELHYHLAGGPSPEAMLSLVTKDDFCLQTDTLTITDQNSECNGVRTKGIVSKSKLYDNIVRSWSMKEFTPHNESGHDHFFNTFMKFMPIVAHYRPQLIANVLERAAAQNEHYLELMDIVDDGNSLTFGRLITNLPNYDKKRTFLLKNKEFQHNVDFTIKESEAMELQAKQELGCSSHPEQKACQIKIKFLYYVLREQPLNNFFAQALNAFEAVSRSQGNLVGVNMVQAEDGVISMRDYQQQMRIFNYLHSKYPKVHISLHAGELTSDFVTEKDLTYHIHDALFIGKAQRIGHGVDITYEPRATLEYMAKNQIPVEINLVSNSHILKISGTQHPLNYYLQHQVPVVLSTDDEGVLRTNLTKQYAQAAQAHNLDYQTLKQINRNTLTYAFIKGKSIWLQANKGEFVPACKNLDSKSCKQFIAKNEKAQLQWELEKALSAFEDKYH